MWEVAAFGVNSVLFLLIGLQLDFRSLAAAGDPVGWGLLALTVGRAAAVYPLLALRPSRPRPACAGSTCWCGAT